MILSTVEMYVYRKRICGVGDVLIELRAKGLTKVSVRGQGDFGNHFRMLLTLI
jgi:hypothetical protein